MEQDHVFGRPTRDLNEPKELKVTLPLRLHIKLHGLKLLRGRTISASVAEALEEYFSREEEGEQAPGEDARRPP